MKYTALEISEILNGKIDGISSKEVTSLNKIEESTKNSITFLGNKKYIPWVYKTKASIIIVSEDFNPKKSISATLIRVKDPYIAFVKLLHKFHDSSIKKSGINDSAVISASSKIGKNVSIGHFSCIGENVVIGKNVVILNNVNIDDNVSIGNNSIIYSGAAIYKNSVIGNNCILHSNAVIGSDGFGFAPDSSCKKRLSLENSSQERFSEIINVCQGNCFSFFFRMRINCGYYVNWLRNVEKYIFLQLHWAALGNEEWVTGTW